MFYHWVWAPDIFLFLAGWCNSQKRLFFPAIFQETWTFYSVKYCRSVQCCILDETHLFWKLHQTCNGSYGNCSGIGLRFWQVHKYRPNPCACFKPSLFENQSDSSSTTTAHRNQTLSRTPISFLDGLIGATNHRAASVPAWFTPQKEVLPFLGLGTMRQMVEAEVSTHTRVPHPARRTANELRRFIVRADALLLSTLAQELPDCFSSQYLSSSFPLAAISSTPLSTCKCLYLATELRQHCFSWGDWGECPTYINNHPLISAGRSGSDWWGMCILASRNISQKWVSHVTQIPMHMRLILIVLAMTAPVFDRLMPSEGWIHNAALMK